jgi:hypothetical protein
MNRISWVVFVVLGVWAGTWGIPWLPAAEDSRGTDVTIDGLHSRTPSNWVDQKSANPMRVYQFRVPRAEGDSADAEVTIFYFRGQGGSAQANIERWKGMFVAPDGKSIDDVTHIDRFKVGDVEATYVDIQGTYKFKARPMDTQAELKPDYRMLAVVFESKKGPYYFRMVGPNKTVTQHKRGFEDWVKGFK